MNELNLVKVKEQNALVVCKNVDLDKSSKPLLDPEQSVTNLIQTLMKHEAYKDTIGVISQALPAREAVYWACLCVRDALEKNPNADDIHAIKAAEQWVIKPNDEDRYLNNSIAEKLEYATASAWVANAVFWSGGSITPKGTAKVEAPEGIFGKAVSGAVMLASVDEDPKQMKILQKRFIDRGIDIAQGGKGDKV